MTDGGDSPQPVPADGGPAPAWRIVERDELAREALPDLYLMSVVRTARTRMQSVSGPAGVYTIERKPDVLVDARVTDRDVAARILRATADELTPAPAAPCCACVHVEPSALDPGDVSALLDLVEQPCDDSTRHGQHVWAERSTPWYCPGADPHTDGSAVTT